MTDEQWLWLYVNQIIDMDEKFEHMCEDCKREVTSENKCHRCGKHIDTHTFINPNFDKGRFEELSKISK